MGKFARAASILSLAFPVAIGFTFHGPQKKAILLTKRLHRPFFSRRTALFSAVPPPEGETDETMSFDEAAKAIVESDNQERIDRVTDDSDTEEYEANRDSYDDMRSRVRSRAADLNIEKSVATADAVKAAEQRARLRMASAPSLNLDALDDNNPFSSQPEDELTDEEMQAADKVGQLPIYEQAFAELRETQFPGVLDVLKTVLFMSLVFAVTAAVIWKSDTVIRSFYHSVGLIPEKGSFDPGDLELPEGFVGGDLEVTSYFPQLQDSAQEATDAAKNAGM